MWPAEMPRMAKDITRQHLFEQKDIVPSTLEELFRWATVTKIQSDGEDIPKNVLVYITSDGAPTDQLTQVAIRVQGFIHKLNLKPTGSWDM